MPQTKASLFIFAFLCFGSLHHSQAGVTAHWSFDKPAVDGKYSDSSGNNFDLVVDQDAEFIASGQRFGTGALNLSRTNLVLKGTPNGGALGLEKSSFSFSFWAKRDILAEGWVLGQGKRMSDLGDVTSYYLHIGFRSDTARYPYSPSLAFQSDDLDLITGTYPTDTKNWHHYVMSYDVDTKIQRIVIDGDVARDITRESFNHFLGELGNNDFYVGNRYGGVRHFDGLLDELWVFDTALSDDEIIALYTNNMGVGKNNHYVDIPEPKSFAAIMGLIYLGVGMMRRRR